VSCKPFPPHRSQKHAFGCGSYDGLQFRWEPNLKVFARFLLRKCQLITIRIVFQVVRSKLNDIVDSLAAIPCEFVAIPSCRSGGML
jgi:hypothetical protein